MTKIYLTAEGLTKNGKWAHIKNWLIEKETEVNKMLTVFYEMRPPKMQYIPADISKETKKRFDACSKDINRPPYACMVLDSWEMACITGENFNGDGTYSDIRLIKWHTGV